MKKVVSAFILLAIGFFVVSVVMVTVPVAQSNSAITGVDVPTKTQELKMTPAQAEAVKSAKSYLVAAGFSKAYLTKQLVDFEKFDRKDAEFALEYLNPDWNKEAVRTAEDYRNTTGFSRAGLIKQLQLGDKYTKKQAIYAADKLYPR